MSFRGIKGTVTGLLSRYVWYVVLIGIGAFAIVLYLYAGERKDHQDTIVDLEQRNVDYALLKEDYKKLKELHAAERAQRQALIDDLASVRDRFQQSRDEADRAYDRLRAAQDQQAALTEEVRAMRLDQQTYRPVTEPPPLLTPPTKDTSHETCNTEPFGPDVTQYVADRLRRIYDNGVSLSNPSRPDPE